MKTFLKTLKLKRRGIALLAGMHFFGNPSAKMKIVGVTGTNGKTSTATMLYKVATELGYKAGLIGTVENIIIKERRPAVMTTPGPIPLHELLNEMKKKGCEYVFMEVSSHAIDQDRIAGINFIGGIFTNLTHDHLDYHKSMENYFGAKKKFFKLLSPSAFALSNIDDEYGARMLEGIRAKKYTFGFKNNANFNEKLETKLLGNFNMYNVLGVYSTAILLGYDKGKVKEILKTIDPPAGRFEYFKSAGGVLGVVDFAHTPDAVEKIILTARDIAKNGEKIISVLGCGGDRDPMKRKVMGKLGASLSDVVIFTSDNPRSEEPEKIIEAMCSDLSQDEIKKVKKIIDREEAIKEAGKISKSGDIILLLGKGHEPYLEIKGIKHPWNDMEKLKQVLS
ncbi:MAG: UDP-N-acetylmuramoyl-L-alanyl-D-glutamate--2,6-diaminopimelate ligase [Patescibacteria group bacterium]